MEDASAESTGSWSIYKISDLPKNGDKPDVLLAVPAYKALVDDEEKNAGSSSGSGSGQPRSDQ